MGRAFRKKSRHPLVSEAFSFDNELPDKPSGAVKVKNTAKLYELTHLFKNGYDKHEPNENKYAICLALICRELNNFAPKKSAERTPNKIDLRHTNIALNELTELYKEAGPLQDKTLSFGINISELIAKKRAAHAAILGASIVPVSQISAIAEATIFHSEVRLLF
ncbi:MAG: hypothetical protein ABI597_13175 [Gammaproteobacteria bacterium]